MPPVFVDRHCQRSSSGDLRGRWRRFAGGISQEGKTPEKPGIIAEFHFERRLDGEDGGVRQVEVVERELLSRTRGFRRSSSESMKKGLNP